MGSPVVDILGEIWELPDPELSARWSRCLHDGDSGRNLGYFTDPYQWTSSATVQSIEARAGELLMFHAAGLSTKDGAVVALIGPSGTGKSTVARTLCRTDFGYVTDETVAVRLDGSVIPFPKPIATIPADGGGKVELSPDELGLVHCPADLRLAGLVVLERGAEHEEPSIERRDVLRAIAAVVPDMSALPQLADGLAHLVRAMDQAGGVFRIKYQEAEHISSLVAQALASPSQRTDFVSIAPEHDDEADTDPTEADGAATDGALAPATADPADALVSRAPFKDALVTEEVVVLLLGNSCLQLQGIGALLWLAAGAGISLDGLRDEVVAAAGEHPESDLLVARAVDELVENGALVRS
ncbi:MAG: hypothetical protein Q4G46_12360 [Propionibacteriaceae bacterium]|nr:hypothetical protein [Propionibacteriaceae bacterium]